MSVQYVQKGRSTILRAPTVGQSLVRIRNESLGIAESKLNILPSGFAAPDIYDHSFEDSTYGPSGDNAGGDEFFTTAQAVDGIRSVGITYVGNGALDQGGGIVVSFAPSLAAARFQMYARWYVRYASGFTGIENIQKLCRFRQQGFGSIMGTLDFQNNAGNPVFDWSWDGDGVSTRSWQVPFSTFNIYDHLDEWLCWEVFNDITPGAFQFRFWQNGALMINTATQASGDGTHPPNGGPLTTNLPTYSGTPFGIFTCGGTFNTLLGRGTQYWDKLALSTQEIGP